MADLKIASTAATTALVNAGVGEIISAADTPLYNERIADFWSLSAQKKPYCIVHPKTTEHVAQIVKTIVAIPDCHFAVRSGGHIAWGASNIDGGVLIDLGLHMNSVSVDKAKGIVSVQPGGRWRDVYKQLEPHGVSVAGGRTGGVGVAGFLTGGGIGWNIPRVGFACDQIVNMEVVLADGRVVNANKDENSDLWLALKGGSGGNFGIVTRFDLTALPYDGMWGGMLISEVNDENTSAHIGAMKSFVDNSYKFPNSSYLVLWHYEPTVFKKVVITSFVANTKGIENPPELKQLCDIPTIVRNMGHTTPYEHSLTMEQPYGYHDNWQTTTFLNDPRIMVKAVEIHAAAVEKIKTASKTGHFSTICLFQAMPSFYKELSEARGGNVMGLDQHLKGRNAVSMLLSINTSEDEIRDFGQQLARDYVRDVNDYAKSLDGYIDWAYLNYADELQNPLASLQNPAAINETALKYDPEAVFQKRTPGHKISVVAASQDKH